jgi:hypothetical protein
MDGSFRRKSSRGDSSQADRHMERDTQRRLDESPWVTVLGNHVRPAARFTLSEPVGMSGGSDTLIA